MKRKSILRLLFLEDMESDFDLATTELRRSKIKFKSTRVECKEAFLKAVVEFHPDIIISDYMMPTFTGMEALKLSLEFRPRIPFIILTGSMNEDTAVLCLRSGAADYVIKEHIARLPYSVKEILEQKELNTQKEHAEKALVESEKAYRLLFDSNPQPMWVFEASTQIFLAVNEAAIAKYGYSKKEFLSLRLTDLIPSVDLEDYQKFDIENPDKTQKTKKNIHQLKDGSLRLIEATSNHINFEGKEARLALVNDITEKVQAEEDLLRSEENFRHSIDESPLGIRIISVDEKTIYANKAFLDIYQFSNLKEFNNTPEKERYTTESYTQYKDRKAERKAGFDVSKYELNIIRKDSEIRHIKVSRKEVVWNGTKHFQVINQDITEQKNAEEKLRKLSLAVEQSPNAVFITDTDAIIEYANPKTLELTGYTKEELIGENPRIFSSGEKSKEAYTQLWNTIKAGNIWKGEMHNRKKSGELYWESAIISPIFDNQGEITHFLAIKEDVTADKKMLEDLILAKEHAEESDRLKSAFLANMSHEIRTPMNGILGFSDLLRDPDLKSEEKDHYIEILHMSGLRMLNTVNDIIEISKIESRMVSLNQSQINVNRVLEEQIQFFAPEAAAKGLKLTIEKLLPETSSMIVTDQQKLDSILSNLIKNAIKYTDHGTIKTGCLLKNNYLEFYILDTGIGIPVNRRIAIFDRFVQADIGDKRAFQGSGLGLSITKAYAEMIGGSIWVKSEEGKGSCFYFTLPCCGISEENKPKVPDFQDQKIDKKFVRNASEMKILIAEDDEVSEMLLTIESKKIGKEIFIARTGTMAVDICRRNPDIDLIFMDIKMPEMDGHEATRQIRQFNKEVIIIAQTAYGRADDRESALEAGCNGYISKPIIHEKLQSVLRKYFD